MTPVVSVPVLSKATVPHVCTASKTCALLTNMSLQHRGHDCQKRPAKDCAPGTAIHLRMHACIPGGNAFQYSFRESY